MANKKITDLQLRSAVTDDLNVPSDDGVQSYRVTAQQFKDYILPLNAIATDRIQDGAVTLAKLASLVQQYLMPVATVLPYMGTSAPTGYLLCQGQAVSRSTYSALFAIIGTSCGAGDGSTTFNLPDGRGQFLRGIINIATITGSGTASGNNATFTGHGFRTGLKVRMTAGAQTGLVTGTTYYVIVIDANTLAFATTLANAIAGTKITISGTTTAQISQWVDPDAASRLAVQSGGNSGAAIGSIQDHTVENHSHTGGVQSAGINYAGSGSWNYSAGPLGQANGGGYYGGNETRPSNIAVNYIIKT